MKRLFIFFILLINLNCHAKYLEIIGLSLDAISLLQGYLSDKELKKISDVKNMIDSTILAEIAAAKSCLNAARSTNDKIKRDLLVTNAFGRISKAHGYFFEKYKKFYQKNKQEYPIKILEYLQKKSSEKEKEIKNYCKSLLNSISRSNVRSRFYKSVKNLNKIYPYVIINFIKYQCEQLLGVKNELFYKDLKKIKTLIYLNTFFAGCIHTANFDKRRQLIYLWYANVHDLSKNNKLNSIIFSTFFNYSFLIYFKHKSFNKAWFYSDINKSVKAFLKRSFNLIDKLEVIYQEPNSYEMTLFYAKEYFRRNKYKKAIELFKKAKLLRDKMDYKNKYQEFIKYNTGGKATKKLNIYYYNSKKISFDIAIAYAKYKKFTEGKKYLGMYIEENGGTFEVYNEILWYLYLNEHKKLIRMEDVKVLVESKNEYHLTTVSAIYAWLGDDKKAFKYCFDILDIKNEKSYIKAYFRVEELLEGKKPREVEEIVRFK